MVVPPGDYIASLYQHPAGFSIQLYFGTEEKTLFARCNKMLHDESLSIYFLNLIRAFRIEGREGVMTMMTENLGFSQTRPPTKIKISA